VSRFLQTKHDGCFRIYNLCAEKKNIDNGFPDHTTQFPCADHTPPDLKAMLKFCKEVESWLREDDQNVAVIHCKAGKGRSGTMACALLVYSQALSCTRDALRWYAYARGGKRRGVTIPSQIRFVAMFEYWLHRGSQALACDPREPSLPKYRLKRVTVGPLHSTFCCKNQDTLMTMMRIGLASRRCQTAFRWVHWFPKHTVNDSRNGTFSVEFADNDGPWWDEIDGMLTVHVCRPYHGCCLQRKKAVLKMSAWWHYSFLQWQKPSLTLWLPKCWIDGFQRDLQQHILAPEDLELTAEFTLTDVDNDAATVNSSCCWDHPGPS